MTFEVTRADDGSSSSVKLTGLSYDDFDRTG